MDVYVIGTRGYPGIQGGVEKHCESLYPLISQKGLIVTVFRRKPYIHNQNNQPVLQGVHFRDIWTLKKKSFEALIHSIISSIICLYKRPSIVHIHNIGPSLVLPLLKIGRLNTVVTYHSPNYEHNKWNLFAKRMLKIGEKFVSKWADEVIFISEFQQLLIPCKNKSYIPNGVFKPKIASNSNVIRQIGATPGRYVLSVSRFVPEKGLHDLIAAFKLVSYDYKLVIAGDADHETDYSRNLRRAAAEDQRIILTGYITGEPLNQVYSHAGLFVLPSYHEGLSIALLEAMSYGLPVLVSDIPTNREIGLPPERYFHCGDVKELKKKMDMLLEKGILEEEKKEIQTLIEEKYSWDRIADQTIQVYQEVIARKELGKFSKSLGKS